MPAEIIDGKAIAATIKQEIAQEIEQRKAQSLPEPGLATVLIGDNPASQSYVRSKIKTCSALGIRSFSYTLPEDVTQHDVLALIRELNENPEVNGILVQLPLPEHLDETEIIAHIAPSKDVDGIHPYNAGLLSRKYIEPLFYPCTPAGIIRLIRSVRPDISGMNAVVIGRSSIVGMPTAMMLSRENATPTICNSYTKNIDSICRNADIIVAAAGSPELVKGSWVKPGAILIDVGINHVPDSSSPKGYRLCGDIDFNECIGTAQAITPVPGGVGPMTIAMLMSNTLRAVKQAL